MDYDHVLDKDLEKADDSLTSSSSCPMPSILCKHLLGGYDPQQAAIQRIQPKKINIFLIKKINSLPIVRLEADRSSSF